MNTLEPLINFYKKHKWGQGLHFHLSLHNNEEFCLVEAIEYIGFRFDSMVGRELRRRCSGDVVKFNDAPYRTFAGIMAMLKQEDGYIDAKNT